MIIYYGIITKQKNQYQQVTFMKDFQYLLTIMKFTNVDDFLRLDLQILSLTDRYWDMHIYNY